jgi:cytochrome c-type biogenesis protein CcmF
MTISLAVLVAATVSSEFIRGGRVIARHAASNIVAGMVQLTRRNTRRYGGYIVHFGVILIMIGFAGAAFNKDVEHELANGDKMSIGPYTLMCKSWTEDSNPNYDSVWAMIDVYKNGKFLETMYPERRFYKASGQPQSMVAIRSTLKEDLYVVFSGTNQDTGHPIIRAHLNPLVSWIWIGILVVIAGTGVALIPNTAPARATLPVRAAQPEEAVGAAR